MNILQVSASDVGGGAEKVAWGLFDAYRRRNHESWLMVGTKKSDDPHIIEIPRKVQSSSTWSRACWVLHGRLQPFEDRAPGVRQMRRWLRIMAEGPPRIALELGREYFNYPGSRRLLTLSPGRPDVVHAHNLHGSYFDLHALAVLSHQLPLALTLHDDWMLTGHCAYALDCERWESGCGRCPNLATYPGLPKDGTADNWRRKRRIYQQSRLYVATPSRWLLDRVSRSMLSPRKLRQIPNGVDLTVFHSSERAKARAELNIHQQASVLLFTAVDPKRGPFKDYATIEQAFRIVAGQAIGEAPIMLLALGGEQEGETRAGPAVIRHIQFERDQTTVARYYQACDIYLHAARADTFPNTILEALACGKPVVATAVGGIPEQVDDGRTGFLVAPGDAAAMASRIQVLLGDEALRNEMGNQAAAKARNRYDLARQVDAYLAWYAEVLEDFHEQYPT